MKRLDEKILGLDLGTSSIGWAVIKKEKEPPESTPDILGAGVNIFSTTVKNLGGGESEKSKNAERREHRGSRRQYERKRYRKKSLLKCLSEKKMCPPYEGNFKAWISSESAKVWFKKNPYELRKKALYEKVSPHDLGRIFYAFIQRRGFLSNSRFQMSESEKSGKIQKGSNDIVGIKTTREAIQENGSHTLGEYLFSLYPNHDDQSKLNVSNQRIRSRYTDRKMYLDEFEALWKKQKEYHPDLLTPSFKNILGGDREKDPHGKKSIIFWQRDLRSQKDKIGKCTFEKKKPRAPIDSFYNQKVRAREFINNIKSIKSNERFLSKELKEKAYDILTNRSTSMKISDLKKKLGQENASWNYQDDESLPSCKVLAKTKSVFGKSWETFDEKTQEKIWNALFFFEDQEKLKDWVIKHFSISEKEAKKFSEIKVKKKYGSLSHNMLKKILPYLEDGELYHNAIILAGFANALERSLNEQDIRLAKEKKYDIEHIKKLLIEDYGKDESCFDKLYHHSLDLEKKDKKTETLPTDQNANLQIRNIRNPVVEKTVFQVRKLVNSLIKKYPGSFDRIHIELARDLKDSKKEREDRRDRNKINEKINEEAKEWLIEQHIENNSAHVEKYKLWQECKQKCPYTDKRISYHQLFNTAEVQVEHIFPKSRFKDDSHANKTLAYSNVNQEKGDRTPFEAYGGHKENWNEMKERFKRRFIHSKEKPHPFSKDSIYMQKTLYAKYLRLINPNPNEDATETRQLNDTRYVSKFVKNYLETICGDVQSTTGQAVYQIRRCWKLNRILDKQDGIDKQDGLDKQDGKKNRDDHRHHAIDAITIACTTPSMIKEINTISAKYDKKIPLEKKQFEQELQASPKLKSLGEANDFYQAVEDVIKRMFVYHEKEKKQPVQVRTVRTKIRNEIRKNKSITAIGKLHEATFLGSGRYRLTALSDIKAAQINQKRIVDPVIWEIIKKRLLEHNLTPGKLNNRGKVKKALTAKPSLTHPNGFPIKRILIVGSELYKRKALSDITAGQINKKRIVDPVIRKIIEKRLSEHNLTPGKLSSKDDDKKIKKALMAEPSLTHPNGFPIKRIRIKENISNTIKLRHKTHVEPGGNYGMLVYETTDKKQNPILKGHVTTFFDAVKLKLANKPIWQLPPNVEGTKKFTLKINDMVIIAHKDAIEWNNPIWLSEHLYRVQKLSATSRNYQFKRHTVAAKDEDCSRDERKQIRTSKDLEKITKVTLSRTGEITPAKQII